MSFSLCIEVNDILQYALADIAKLRILVGAHTTDDCLLNAIETAITKRSYLSDHKAKN